ncbi:hypothetical protein N7478_000088 [Penicillium angulare]|uniref:uncharacterized protein n=1 Tax=Penicillium angulare TaxID=116970 RepID=UPI00254234EA|nr:uncharacterized protein N7478_000088 [Penicillium angulare]KAJ5290837.1 hypothetical protein N7478_000088 [Penicillium angulare]
MHSSLGIYIYLRAVLISRLAGHDTRGPAAPEWKKPRGLRGRNRAYDWVESPESDHSITVIGSKVPSAGATEKGVRGPDLCPFGI